MYSQVLNQFRRYIGHVTTNIGGVYQYYKTSDQDGAVYTHVSKSHQKACLNFLNKNLFETPYWMINQEILNKIEYAGTTERIRSLQSSYLNRILDFGRMARMIENEALNGLKSYSLIEMMDDLKNGIWSELEKGDNIDVYRRNLQKSYILRLAFIMKNDQESRPGWGDYITNVKVNVSDIRSVTMSSLVELKKELKKAIKKYSDKSSKSHLDYCISMIDEAIKTS